MYPPQQLADTANPMTTRSTVDADTLCSDVTAIRRERRRPVVAITHPLQHRAADDLAGSTTAALKGGSEVSAEVGD